MASASASARKPIRPRLTPSTGTSALRASSAARKKVPSPPKHQHQFAALGGVGVGVDDLDFDAHRPHVVRSQLQRSPVDRLGGQHAKANIVVAQHFFNPSRGLGRFLAPGVHHQQDGAFIRHCGPASTAAADGGFQLISRQTPIGFGAQPQEVFDIARRTR